MDASRRHFLQWLAASPLFGAEPELISDPKQALNVFEFEPVMRKVVPPAHYGYMATGVDDDATLRANRDAFGKVKLRPRRLVDVRTISTEVELFGAKLECPILTAPTGQNKAFHADGEMAVARAAKARKTQMILSTMTTSPIEDIVQAAGGPVWYQLYATQRWEVTTKLVRRAEAAGSPVIALTVDTNSGRRTDTFEKFKRLDSRPCQACHPPGSGYKRKSMFTGIDQQGLTNGNPGMDWTFVKRLRDQTKAKLVIKGLETGEDAALACENGVDGIIVSNHGARATETGRGTMEALPEVIEAVKGRIPVLIDGGFRRGTDVFKALALGARAVCIGRPYLWGLGAFGEPGVDRVLELMRSEFELVMRQCGTRSIADITRSYVILS